MKGKVLKVDATDGTGYIKGEDGETYWFKREFVTTPGIHLQEEEAVSFDRHPPVFGQQHSHQSARSIKRLVGQPPRRDARENPFKPDAPITEGVKFAGRLAQLKHGAQLLADRRSVFVTGEARVGKSSFANQLLTVLVSDRSDPDFRELAGRGVWTRESVDPYVAIVHQCNPADDVGSIVSGLTDSLRAALSRSTTRVTNSVQFTVGAAQYTHEVSTSNSHDSPAGPPARFVRLVADALGGGQKGGLVVFIDEIDAFTHDSARTAQLAYFFKGVKERLELDKYLDVIFVLAGISGSTTSLLSQNPSFMSTFDNVDLPRMVNAELEDIVDRALAGTGLTIAPDAKWRIAHLADGLPGFVQTVGARLYASKRSGRIEDREVLTATATVLQERVRIHDELVGSLSSEERRVAVAIAEHDSWADARGIASRAVLPEEVVARILGDDTKRAFSATVSRRGRDVRMRDPLLKLFLTNNLGL